MLPRFCFVCLFRVRRRSAGWWLPQPRQFWVFPFLAVWKHTYSIKLRQVWRHVWGLGEARRKVSWMDGVEMRLESTFEACFFLRAWKRDIPVSTNLSPDGFLVRRRCPDLDHFAYRVFQAQVVAILMGSVEVRLGHIWSRIDVYHIRATLPEHSNDFDDHGRLCSFRRCVSCLVVIPYVSIFTLIKIFLIRPPYLKHTPNFVEVPYVPYV